MMLRSVKWAVQAALLVQVLQYSVSVDGTDVNFETLKGEQEERSDDDMATSPMTPGPFYPRPTTESMLSGHEGFLKKMGVDLSPFSSKNESTDGSSAPAADTELEDDDDPVKLGSEGDKFASLLSGLGGGGGGGAVGSGGEDAEIASLLSGLGGGGGGDGGGGGGGGDDKLASLLSGLTGGSGGKEELVSLLGGIDGSGIEDTVLDEMLEDTGGSDGMPSFKEFMSAMGGGGGMGGLGAMFGMADPTEPQNITVNDGDIIYGDVYGSLEHGDTFSDIENIKFGQYVVNITIRGAARVDKFGITVMTQETYGILSHGGDGGGLAHIEPKAGSHINSVEVHWQKHNGKTCIFYLEVIASDGQTISAGKKTANTAIIKPPKDFQIGGFHGRATSAGIFGIGAIFIKKGVQDVAVTDVMAVSDQGSPNIYHYNTTIRNWLGPMETATDSGCYMRRHEVSSKKMCPSGYRKDGGKCVTQCPILYPINCVLECIPQNSDCTQAVIAKVSAVVSVALNVATMGIFGAMLGMYKKANFIVMCAVAVVNAIKSLLFYLRYRQVTISHTDIEKMMDRAFQLQIVTLDLPIAICACMGIKIPPKLLFPVIIVTVVSAIVLMALMIGEMLFKSKENILIMLREAGVMNGSAVTTDAMELDDFLHKPNSTCGSEIQTLTNRVMGKVKEIRAATPHANEDDVRVAVSQSPIIKEDIPIVTNHCMGEVLTNHTVAAAYKTRNQLRKALNIIIEQLIKDGTTDMAKNMVKKEKALEYANLGLFILSMLDPTGIAWMASEFVQPICGPTEFLGEIDDGHLHEALGLTAVDHAFSGSHGIWKKKGDGSVKVFFESYDKFDVNVIIYSAGEKINEAKVPAHGKVTWTATVKDLEDKTLYMDRWRPGLFGLPGSGGGSLLLWVPRSALGGQLILHARINVS